MKNLSYFNAYMRGERSSQYLNSQYRNNYRNSQYSQYDQHDLELMGWNYSISYGWQEFYDR
jgi:hypothetical protein